MIYESIKSLVGLPRLAGQRTIRFQISLQCVRVYIDDEADLHTWL